METCSCKQLWNGNSSNIENYQGMTSPVPAKGDSN
jgi:hypothetical protein